jgi:WD40-like Beta Propeller Repeat
MFTKRIKSSGLIVVPVLVAASVAAAATGSGPWDHSQKIDDVGGNSTELNTPSLDGCPILSPDGRSLYMASNRPGGHGGLDIWVAHRSDTDQPFGDPENLPAPINSSANDFCPTPLRGNRLLFVSNRDPEHSCGMGDIYEASDNPKHGWSSPRHLACAPDGPNSELDEQGPSLVEIDGGTQLFFSRSVTGSVPGDIFVSRDFGPAVEVTELNTADNELQPNVRKDGREVVFSSNHAYPNAQGGQDIYVSTRASTDEPWSEPVNLGEAVNESTNETRPSLSWDGHTLLFGRAPGPEGMSDIYISTR